MSGALQRGTVRPPVNVGAVKAVWPGEGFTFGIFRDAPGQAWNGFRHDSGNWEDNGEGGDG